MKQLYFLLISIPLFAPVAILRAKYEGDKRYNQIAWIEAHNATSTPDPHGAFPNTKSLVDNQDIPLSRQLEIGVRVFQFHIHYDYKNPFAFYANVLQARYNELKKEIDTHISRLKQDHANDFKKLQDAIDTVNGLQRQIDDMHKKIDEEKRSYDALPKFSFSGNSQTLEAIPHGAKLTGYYSALGGLIVSQKTAVAVLYAAKKVWDAFLDADPRLIPARAEKLGIEAALKVTGPGYVQPLQPQQSPQAIQRGIHEAFANIKSKMALSGSQPTKGESNNGESKPAPNFDELREQAKGDLVNKLSQGNAVEQQEKIAVQLKQIAQKFGASMVAAPATPKLSSVGGSALYRGDQSKKGIEIFCCHGLPKEELYQQVSVDDLVSSAPEVVKIAVKPILEKVVQGYRGTVKGVLGEKKEIGGIVPYTPCFIDNSRRTLASVLIQMKEWLEAHPTDVITLELNDFRCSEGPCTFDDVAQVFEQAHILPYAHAQPTDQLWPTINELIKANKRLIVFISGSPDKRFPWLHGTDFFFPWRTKFSFSNASEIADEGSTPEDILRGTEDEKKNMIADIEATKAGQVIDNKLVRIIHSVTVGLAGSKKIAEIVNKKNVLLPRLIKIANTLNHAPNFISLDFVEVPNMEAFEAVNDFNSTLIPSVRRS